ncbi:hypothetical protein BGZ63DRAFT_397623 [Mariannaea sp. PMI_226]|nr:hypothetical protein BGZ63DRAFT_397623 [Mariannaea sp. PMI_226]
MPPSTRVPRDEGQSCGYCFYRQLEQTLPETEVIESEDAWTAKWDEDPYFSPVIVFALKHSLGDYVDRVFSTAPALGAVSFRYETEPRSSRRCRAHLEVTDNYVGQCGPRYMTTVVAVSPFYQLASPGDESMRSIDSWIALFSYFKTKCSDMFAFVTTDKGLREWHQNVFDSFFRHCERVKSAITWPRFSLVEAEARKPMNSFGSAVMTGSSRIHVGNAYGGRSVFD